MTTHWTISIDWERDGNLTSSYNDITSRVMQTNWFLGMRKPYQDKADNSILTLILNNADRLYSPENASSPLFGNVVPQRPVRVQSNDGTTTRTHWLGWIEAIQPAVGKFGERIIKILASGPMLYYTVTETNLELQENQRTDQIIAKLVQEVVMPPALSTAWVLERTGNSELNRTAYLADLSAASVLEEGTVTLGMAADNWVRRGGLTDVSQDSFDVYRAMGM